MNLGGKQRGLSLQDMSSSPFLAARVGVRDLGSGLNPERMTQRQGTAVGSFREAEPAGRRDGHLWQDSVWIFCLPCHLSGSSWF